MLVYGPFQWGKEQYDWELSIVYYIGVIQRQYTLHLHYQVRDTKYWQTLPTNMENFYWEAMVLKLSRKICQEKSVEKKQ